MAKHLLGRVIGMPSGFGIIESAEAKEEFTLVPEQMTQVLDGDKILFSIGSRRVKGRRVANLQRIVSRSRRTIFAHLYTKNTAKPFAVPYSPKIPREVGIDGGSGGKLIHKSLVEIKLTPPHNPKNFPDSHLRLPVKLRGRVVRTLAENDKSYETDIAIAEFSLRTEFPKSVVAEAKHIPERVPSTELGRSQRRDLTHLPFCTIDGSDAKDYDDAIYCKREGKGLIRGRGKKAAWRLWVAIADVSHYVTSGSELDSEAQKRTSSVYFPDRVLPMLPEKLSNGICSLNPKEERLVLVCEMQVDAAGKVSQHQFYEAVILSRQRLTYEQVASFLGEKLDKTAKKEGLGKIGHELHAPLKDFHSLAKVLLDAREKRYALNFKHLEEQRIEFDNAGHVHDIYYYKRNLAHLMIEEAMLLANVCAAKFLEKQRKDFCYRVHPSPEQEKFDDLRRSLAPYNIMLPHKVGTSKDYCRILEQVHKKEGAFVLEMMVLKSMQAALYSLRNLGHFGLNYQTYTHFTSPIRRYPDLLNHRAIKSALRRDKNFYPYKKDGLTSMARQCSDAEKNITKAGWQVLGALKCHYLLRNQRDSYEGTITYIAEHSFFVRLGDSPLEGRVLARKIKDDYYKYDYRTMSMRGSRRGKVLKVGDRVKVKVEMISPIERYIDLVLLG